MLLSLGRESGLIEYQNKYLLKARIIHKYNTYFLVHLAAERLVNPWVCGVSMTPRVLGVGVNPSLPWVQFQRVWVQCGLCEPMPYLCGTLSMSSTVANKCETQPEFLNTIIY